MGQPEELAEELPSRGRVGGSTRAGSLIGTLSCMSPEQLRGEHAQLDARSDLYAVGLLLFELLKLRHPFGGVEDPSVLATLQKELRLGGSRLLKAHPYQRLPPIEYLYFCGDLCTYKVEDRVPSAVVALQMIEALERGEVPVRCHLTLTKRMTRESGRWVERHPNTAFLAMVLGAVAVVAGLGVFAGMW